MINLRYLLVVVSSVFLAVAVGLGMGSLVRTGTSTPAEVASVRTENQDLRAEVDRLSDASADGQAFAEQVAPATLAGLLDGDAIVVLSAAGADQEYVDGVVDMLGHTNGVGAGRMVVSDRFVDPASNEDLLDLVSHLTPKNYEPPNNIDGVESAANLLATALLSVEPAISTNDRDAFIAGLIQLGMVTVQEELADEVSGVIIVTGEPYSGDDAEPRNAAVVTMAEQFGTQGPAVLAASTSSGDGNPVSTVTEDSGLAESMSTVNNVSGPVGQMACVLAVAERIDGGVGHYGTGEKATSTVPETP